MKKSLIAVAVAGAVGAPMSAAQAAEAYGFVFAGVDTNTSVEGFSTAAAQGGAAPGFGISGVPNVFAGSFTRPTEQTFLGDTAETRFGFKGSEDLGNGMTASYQFEFGLVTESFGGQTTSGGSVAEDTVPQTRLAWVALGGDWGEVKLGTQWSVAYEYMGWNVFRSRGHGGASWYRMFNGGWGNISDGRGSFTALTPDNPSGLRIDNAVAYTYGGGGYSSDPFTFTVEARLDHQDNGDTGAADDREEGIDQISIGAQGTVGDFTINGFISQAMRDGDSGGAPNGDREPSIAAVGGRWNGPSTTVGLAIMQTDIDADVATFAGSDVDPDGDPFGVIVEATHDFGNGWSGMAMVGTVDGDDAIHDMESNFFLQVDYAFSSRTHFQIEFEHAELDSEDNAACEARTTSDGTVPRSSEDAEQQVLSVGLFHSF